MSRFLFGLGGKWIILPSLVFKTALFTVIILIKSAPSTATQSKIACVFSEGSEKLPSGMVVAKKSKKSKKSTKKKIKKIIKKHGVRIFEYSPVSLGVYSGTSLHCCAQPYSLRPKWTSIYSLNHFFLKWPKWSYVFVSLTPRYERLLLPSLVGRRQYFNLCDLSISVTGIPWE